jgi:enterochelin esterase-like enzyme
MPGIKRMTEIAAAARQSDGTLMHTVSSPFQADGTCIHVLLPDPYEPEQASRVVYLLPVELFDDRQCGDPLDEVRKHDLHNKHRVICVKPTFSHAPWYADHPSDPSIRQESHLLKVVVPFVDGTYLPNATSPERLLVGFSKSGWGAFSLLLRHPDVFSRAAAFDAPFGWETPNRYGMAEVFETQSNMDEYCVNLLIDRAGRSLGDAPRLALCGHGEFRGHHQFLHYRMLKLGIPHVFEDCGGKDHRWDSGWLPQAIAFAAGEQ